MVSLTTTIGIPAAVAIALTTKSPAPSAQRLDSVGLVCASCENHDEHVRVGRSDIPAQHQPVRVRQPQVQEHQIGARLGQESLAARAVWPG